MSTTLFDDEPCVEAPGTEAPYLGAPRLLCAHRHQLQWVAQDPD